MPRVNSFRLVCLVLTCSIICATGCTYDVTPSPVGLAGNARRIAVSEPCAKTVDGKQIDLITLVNSNGLRARIITYGAIMTSLEVPDRHGRLDDIVLGFDNAEDYMSDDYVKGCPYFGSIVGRYANRICRGKFKLRGEEFTLATNNGDNHLHGGDKGFDKVVWTVEKPFMNEREVGVALTYLSKDGEEGYPGNLECRVIYSLNDNNELIIQYSAETDKPTIVNLSQHNYYNLAGQGKRDILDHKLLINADYFIPVDEGLIPTGELRCVEGTPFDFRKPTAIGKRIDKNNCPQLALGKGYDHNWVLNRNKKPGMLDLAAKVVEPSSGRIMEVYTTEPGIQFYSGNFLDGTLVGKQGRVYHLRFGFCLETQHFPDSPNQPEFPSVTLMPDQTYSHKTVFRFSVKSGRGPFFRDCHDLSAPGKRVMSPFPAKRLPAPFFETADRDTQAARAIIVPPLPYIKKTVK